LGEGVESSLPPADSSPAKPRITTLVQRTSNARMLKFGAVAAFVALLVGWQIWRERSQPGQISAPEEKVAEIRALVARRKAKRESLANKPMIDPRLLTITSQAEAEMDVLLKGTSGSPGLAQGPARIVHDVSEFGKLRAGDVLVAPVTNPAWTPLFQRAAAVVVDTGGAASHAAIVAREYGVPAVMGTMNGTKELEDGQWIQVDGSRGLVLKAKESR